MSATFMATLKAEINAEVWDSLHSDTSRPFPQPASGLCTGRLLRSQLSMKNASECP
jgi:hypothetical protein